MITAQHIKAIPIGEFGITTDCVTTVIKEFHNNYRNSWRARIEAVRYHYELLGIERDPNESYAKMLFEYSCGGENECN